jgi:type VI secretion system ImpC/EvpB family protein
LVDLVLEATHPDAAPCSSVLHRFVHEPSPVKALALWLVRVAGLSGVATRRQVLGVLARDIAQIDRLLTRQVNAILHHADFQRLEAAWRGLEYLVRQVPDGSAIKVRVLHLPWKELCRDLERALEFDQSQLFRKVYDEEFGTPGGQPFGVLLGDYQVRHRPGPDSPTDDLRVLSAIASVAAAAFAPFVAGVHPALIGLDSFTELELPLNLTRTLQAPEYRTWSSFRLREDARFIGLTLPRVLMRLPHDGRRSDGFCFREEVAAPTGNHYLWGSAVYAFGAVLVRAFAECGWLDNIRGVPAGDALSGGLATNLPVASFHTDAPGVAPRPSTDALIPERLEKELADLGFLSLCHCPATDLAAFHSTPSVQRPKEYDAAPAGANARLSAMLQYVLCVSRFAHYLKVIARDLVGSFGTAERVEEHLNRWLLNYVTSNESPSEEERAKCPLREAQVQVRDHPDKPGSYRCVIRMRPHPRLDQVAASIRLSTVLQPHQG